MNRLINLQLKLNRPKTKVIFSLTFHISFSLYVPPQSLVSGTGRLISQCVCSHPSGMLKGLVARAPRLRRVVANHNLYAVSVHKKVCALPLSSVSDACAKLITSSCYTHTHTTSSRQDRVIGIYWHCYGVRSSINTHTTSRRHFVHAASASGR